MTFFIYIINKKTQKTSQQDIEIGKQRYQAMIELRKKLKEN